MTLEQLETHRSNFEGFYEKHSKWTKQELTVLWQGQGYRDGLTHGMWCAYCWALTVVDRAQRAAPGVQVVGMRDGKYIDSTPNLHVGNSSFEDWYQAHEKACTGDKQLARDAYAAGMGDPLVTYVQPPQQSAQPVADSDLEKLATDLELYSDYEKGRSQADFLDPVLFGRAAIALYAAAQPVEVQQVALIDALQELMAWQVKNVHCWNNSAYDNAAKVLKDCGIKPTSSKGGAA